MTVKIRKYSWQLAPTHIRDIRQKVFVEEQKVPPELEWDDTDEIADHFLAVSSDNRPAGVARLFSTLGETGHIGRMAILPEFRGQGIGEALLWQLIKESAGQYQELKLSAQQHAIPFYQRAGFHVCSEPYDDAGIPHLDMRNLAPALLADQADNKRSRPMLLGTDTQPWLFDTESSMIDLMDSMVGQAGQRLWLYDQLLDHDRYDRQRLSALISSLARRHRLSEVRLLIHDDKPLVKRRHQLVELMRRLPSRIELRLVNKDYPHEDQPYLIADREGVVYRHDFSGPSGFAGFADSGRVRLLAENFQRMWDAGHQSLELRELPI
ncbi:GNAT family N-acetyltransferase [Marinobacter sp. ANT_B65]|uniref:GNAT family N-acetyltransferase n=1 Tax=Marinobacter sp. ANT_B65 TaxID=2039467 RepID=UPI000BBEFA56|nr:GNAT family N-acetyltransferase [Marinobacter sp. ANT_B65]PCM45517.1 GNAT family N-acetyltransferase [Marinobacter sp. ANT_B65]